MFRARIFAQAFTLLAVVAGGIYFKEERQKEKQIEATISERKAIEKRERWIKELEARDEEEKALKARRRAFASAKRDGSDVDAAMLGNEDRLNVKRVNQPGEGNNNAISEAVKEMERGRKGS
jgi:hypothetical protein